MSLLVHMMLIVGAFIAAALVKRVANASKISAQQRIGCGPKIQFAEANKRVEEVDNCVYVLDDQLDVMEVSWNFVRGMILIKGPGKDISHPAFSHEMGHARIYRRNLDKFGKPLRLDYSKNDIINRLASMFWYEYLVERRAWKLSEYWNTGFSIAALRGYVLGALWNDLDIAGTGLVLAFIVRLVF